MREAIGTQEIFKIIIVFTLLFSGFIAVAITYNKAYKIKNEVINIVEKYEGTNNQALNIINNYLSTNGYNSTNTCAENEYGIKDLSSNNYELAKGSTRYFYCLSFNIKENQIFYKIKLFSRFNLPFIGDLFYFKITGETKGIKFYSENQKLKG